MRLPAIATAAAGAALIALLGPATAPGQGAKPRAKPAGPPPAPVVVAVAERRRLAPVTWYPGTVISRHQARIAAEVEGRLERVAEVGETVPAGGEVARIDPTLLEQTLAENRAAVAREIARLAFLDAEVARLEKLASARTATRSQLDQAVADRGVSRSELAAARARVAITEERLRRTRVRAPFPGVVAERYLQAGEWAQSGQAIVRLVDTATLEVQTWIPVHSLRHTRPGTVLAVRGNPHDARGAVRTVVPVGDERSRLYELRLTLEGGDDWPVGQSIRVAVPTDEPREVVAVPRDALVLRRDSVSVFRVREDGTAERVAVRPGIASGDLIEVAGIEPGDRVVTRGGERLRPGQKVRVVAAPGAP